MCGLLIYPGDCFVPFGAVNRVEERDVVVVAVASMGFDDVTGLDALGFPSWLECGSVSWAVVRGVELRSFR